MADGAAESFISHFADKAVLFDLPPPLQVQSDRSEGVDALNRWFATWDGRVESVVPEPTIIIDGDLALVFASQICGASRKMRVLRICGSAARWHCDAKATHGKSCTSIRPSR
ncbi:MAG: hypothetical protein Q7T86_01755 [Hyphomicrobiaceae bacterium]|nr:hypothetical protein [Hyphomicrobiaceae bacterium]